MSRVNWHAVAGWSALAATIAGGLYWETYLHYGPEIIDALNLVNGTGA